jgi:hypothetical protein
LKETRYCGNWNHNDMPLRFDINKLRPQKESFEKLTVGHLPRKCLPFYGINGSVYYRVHKSLALDHVLRQMNPFHNIKSYLRPILILSSHKLLGPEVVSFLMFLT